MKGSRAVFAVLLVLPSLTVSVGAQIPLRLRADRDAAQPGMLHDVASTPVAHGPAQPAAPGRPVSKAAASPQTIAAGHQLFNDNCEHCHGPDAVEGLEQRNLRHLYLRYGNKMDQVFLYTVTHGRPTKGMPNWSGILSMAEFHKILAYLHSIQGH